MEEETLNLILSKIIQIENRVNNRQSFGVGLTSVEEVSSKSGVRTIYVGRQHGGLWYEWDPTAQKATTVPLNALQGTLSVVTTKLEGGSEYGEKEKIVFNFATDDGKFQVRSGTATAFTMCVVQALNSLEPSVLKGPITIAVSPGKKQTTTLANVILPSGKKVFQEDRDENAKWKDIYSAEIAKLIETVRKINPNAYAFYDARNLIDETLPESLAAATTSQEIAEIRDWIAGEWRTFPERFRSDPRNGEQVKTLIAARLNELNLPALTTVGASR